jgi:hypothetical protein
VPGRIRMKVPQAKQDPAVLETYREIFASIPGALKVKAKPETGSIVIHYDPERRHEFHRSFDDHCDHHLEMAVKPEFPGNEVQRLARKIEAEADYLASRSQFANASVHFFREFDRELKLATDNNVDLQILLAAGLAGFTFLEIGATAATPMWVTLALFTLNHFVELHSGEVVSRSPPKAAENV